MCVGSRVGKVVWMITNQYRTVKLTIGALYPIPSHSTIVELVDCGLLGGEE